MTLPASGQITIYEIINEVDEASNGFSLNNSYVRTLAGKTIAGQQISFADLYGKSASLDTGLVVIVGGGGGGGVGAATGPTGAGGGGGGWQYFVEPSLAAGTGIRLNFNKSYTVTVGTGGTAGTASNGRAGGNGGDSIFKGYTAGGGQGGQANGNGGNSGSPQNNPGGLSGQNGTIFGAGGAGNLQNTYINNGGGGRNGIYGALLDDNEQVNRPGYGGAGTIDSDPTPANRALGYIIYSGMGGGGGGDNGSGAGQAYSSQYGRYPGWGYESSTQTAPKAGEYGGGGGGGGRPGSTNGTAGAAGGTGFVQIRYYSPTQRFSGGDYIWSFQNSGEPVMWVHWFNNSGTLTGLG